MAMGALNFVFEDGNGVLWLDINLCGERVR